MACTVVQQVLGHKSATMTLDPYGHLFPDQLDQVAGLLDADARAAVYPLCTRANRRTLSQRAGERRKSLARQGILRSSPDGIRTRANALRGRRARPLHNGALASSPCQATASRYQTERFPANRAGVLGLEPRRAEPESAGLPITPYPIDAAAPKQNSTGADGRGSNRYRLLPGRASSRRSTRRPGQTPRRRRSPPPHRAR